jgi:diacylglycerol kinase (ATP)
VPRRVLIIANPAAGRMRSRGMLDPIVAALGRRGCCVEVRLAEAPGSVERLARGAEPHFDVIAAAGGDGTVNAIVNGLAGAPRPVAVLPLGTVNLLAREMGMPSGPEALAQVLASGEAVPIWPGRVGERLFTVVASCGIDAEVVAAVDPTSKSRFGRLAFVGPVLRCLRNYRRCDLSVRVGDVEHRAAAVIAAKGRYYAGRFVAAPEASVADPILQIVLLERSGRAAVLGYAAALLRGKLARCPGVTIVQCRAATVSASAPMPVQADGEIIGPLPLTIGIAERPLPLIRP